MTGCPRPFPVLALACLIGLAAVPALAEVKVEVKITNKSKENWSIQFCKDLTASKPSQLKVYSAQAEGIAELRARGDAAVIPAGGQADLTFITPMGSNPWKQVFKLRDKHGETYKFQVEVKGRNAEMEITKFTGVDDASMSPEEVKGTFQLTPLRTKPEAYLEIKKDTLP